MPKIAFNTGMRAAEVIDLTWDRVDLDYGFITVDRILLYGAREWIFATPKTNSSNRKIKIGNTLILVLKQSENKLKYRSHYTNNDFVCTKENGEFLTTDSLKYLSRVVTYELLIPFNFHSLRRTHATMLLETGANIKYIQKRLGHNRISTTLDTYSHVTKQMQENSVYILEGILHKNKSKIKTSDAI